MCWLLDTVRERWGWAGFVVFSVQDGVSLIDVSAPTTSPEDTETFETIEEVKSPARRNAENPLMLPIMEN